MLFRLRSIVLAAILVLGLPWGVAVAGSAKAVVELFTSQGCSRCPPADALLAELARQDDVIALSFHVDYWNYIGWRDPFSSAASTARQRAYERGLKRRYVYTPQIVVDGVAETVGSKRDRVHALIAAASRNRKLDIGLNHDNPRTARMSIPASPYTGPPAAIWVAFYDSSRTTSVRAGENKGMTLTNRNIVRSITRVGTWTGKRVDLELDLETLGARGRDGCAVLVQAGGSGQILGAAAIQLPRELH